MEDDDLKELLTRIKIGLIFIGIVSIIFLIMIFKKFGAENTNILSKISRQKDLYILVVESKCDNCKTIKKILKDNKVNYETINVDIEKYYDTILKKLEITKKDIKEPSLIYIKDKKVYSILVDIKEDELISFIENYNISN